MHFFTEQDLSEAASVVLSGESAHHLLHVLRIRPGEIIELSDACGRTYRCQLTGTSQEGAVFSVEGEIEKNRELPCRITLFQSLAKGDKMAFVIQKAVELGVARIVPVITERTVARPDHKGAAHKRERWQKIAQSAAKQCGRAVIPEVDPVVMFDDALEDAAASDHFLFPYECAEGMTRSREVFNRIEPGSSVSIMIGPEGGFELAEVDAARRAGALIVTLGSRILRTETAALTALSWLVFKLEEE